MKYLRLILVAAVALLAVGAPATARAEEPCGRTYTVVRGDTLTAIARRCTTTVAAILRANPVVRNPNIIPVGLRLNIPAPQEPGGSALYVVKPGDTLSRIAARFGTTVSAILRANPEIRNPNVIYVGQRLRIPEAGGPVSTTVNVFLIGLGTGQIGCGDEAVPVTPSGCHPRGVGRHVAAVARGALACQGSQNPTGRPACSRAPTCSLRV
ncbi:MAG TPA: hypothetical protein DEP84_02480 [Chloroflexi bacterium]|nr:hypothetical protein [Chloroflexota bacterium]